MIPLLSPTMDGTTCVFAKSAGTCAIPPIVLPPPYQLHLPAQVSACVDHLLGACLVRPPAETAQFFGFAVFVTALTLIAVVFSVSDIRYRFRIAIAPIPLISLSFWLTVPIGLAVLVSDVWFAARWGVPVWFPSHVVLQGVFGFTFFAIFLLWMFFAFIRPPIFGRWTAQQYRNELLRVVARGSDHELPIIAGELSRSAKAIVACCVEEPDRRDDRQLPLTTVQQSAYEIFLILGNRKLCRHLVASAPGTAIAFFVEIAGKSKFHLPLHPFAANVSSEAVLNTDSILYHEDDGYASGWFGYQKPFSHALYGNFRLVEGISGSMGSTLDVDLHRPWDADRLEAYTRAVLLTFKDYLSNGWGTHSYALFRACSTIKGACQDIPQLNGKGSSFDTDAWRRLHVAVRFFQRAVEMITEMPQPPTPIKLRARSEHGSPRYPDMYDRLASFAADLIELASYVRSPNDDSWGIQYSLVWSQIFRHHEDSPVWRIIWFKLRRRVFESITRFGRLNFQSSRILGMCLNCAGIDDGSSDDFRGRNEYIFRTALLAWTKKNLMRNWYLNSDVVLFGLPEGLTVDPVRRELVKTYSKGLRREAPREVFKLDKARMKFKDGQLE